MRYILALLPSESASYTEAAQKIFAPFTDGYLLAEGRSFPHVTLCSFQCDEEKKIEQIWKNVCSHEENCPLRFLRLLLKKGKVPPNHYSIGLSVAREPPILQLHHRMLNLLHTHNLDPLNPCGDLYQPHLTLAGISWPPSISLTLSSLIDNLIGKSIHPFQIALGRGDDIGQYLETLFE